MTSTLPLQGLMDTDIAKERLFVRDGLACESVDVRDGADDGQLLLYCH